MQPISSTEDLIYLILFEILEFVQFLYIVTPSVIVERLRKLRYWPLDNVLLQNDDFVEQDVHALVEFLVPLLNVKCS